MASIDKRITEVDNLVTLSLYDHRMVLMKFNIESIILLKVSQKIPDESRIQIFMKNICLASSKGFPVLIKELHSESCCPLKICGRDAGFEAGATYL